MVESGGLVCSGACACLSADLAWDNSVGAEMSSSDGMLMKGKCQCEFGSILGLQHFIAGYV